MTTTTQAKRDRDVGAGCAVVTLLILLIAYIIIDSHYDQADHGEIKDLRQRVEILERKGATQQ